MRPEFQNIEISPSPLGLESKFGELFTPEAIQFLGELVATFQFRVTEILRARKIRKLTLDSTGGLPDFQPPSTISKEEWTISPLPHRLQNRHLDLGDLSPSNSQHLRSALLSEVQGIQVDFDDGHCPSWRNMIEGIHNVVAFTRGQFYPNEVRSVSLSPVLLMRPRAWNMSEHNILVNGKEVPGPLMEFGLLMFHTGQILSAEGVGPYFYLSKVEGAREAQLWNDIFVWTQKQLLIPVGTVKACVLIENILSAFEMDEILYELRQHSLGLNCGFWDYSASIINKFGERPEFLLPDRNKYVNIEKHFLSSYMKLLVQTCHRRGAPATGGMASVILAAAKDEDEKMKLVETVCLAKLQEIDSGVDGFLVYDPELVPWINKLWLQFGSNHGPNQIGSVLHKELVVTAKDLLTISPGGVTTAGLKHNTKVGILFIYSWISNARGVFVLDGVVEDSATAEISRSQLWQWIYHQTKLEDGTEEKITKSLVSAEAWSFYDKLRFNSNYDAPILEQCVQILLEVVTATEYPEFLTTLLYNHSTFRGIQFT